MTDPQSSRYLVGSDSFQVQIEPLPAGTIAKEGPRFDTTATVSQISVNGRKTLTLNGLTDEFNILAPFDPPGFEEAATGGTFLKIGVGILRRHNDIHYQFWQPYPLVQLAENRFVGTPQEPAYEQTAKMGDNYAYRYCKKYHVDTAERRLVISYQITNTGKNEMKVEHYNHNYFAFEGLTIDGSYRVQTDFATPTPLPKWLARRNNQLMLPEPMKKGQGYFMRIPAPVEQNRFRLFHHTGGMGVHVSGDFPLARFTLYADASTMSPEIFMQATLKPGETASWSRTYTFFVNQNSDLTRREEAVSK